MGKNTAQNPGDGCRPGTCQPAPGAAEQTTAAMSCPCCESGELSPVTYCDTYLSSGVPMVTFKLECYQCGTCGAGPFERIMVLPVRTMAGVSAPRAMWAFRAKGLADTLLVMTTSAWFRCGAGMAAALSFVRTWCARAFSAARAAA
jgi:hypothetical protein